MRRAKHGIKVLRLGVLAAVGTMALMATEAQGTFLINLGSALLATITARQVGAGFFLVPGRDYKIECTSFNVEEGKILTSTEATLKTTHLGCASFSLSSGEAIPCFFTTLGSITTKALILTSLHGGATFLIFEPVPPSLTFTTVSYKSGTECPLPLNNPIQGVVAAKVDALDAVRQLLLFSPVIQLLIGAVLKFGGLNMYVDRHAEFELAGAHAGWKLGIH